jgi:hypothetical protein
MTMDKDAKGPPTVGPRRRPATMPLIADGIPRDVIIINKAAIFAAVCRPAERFIVCRVWQSTLA